MERQPQAFTNQNKLLPLILYIQYQLGRLARSSLVFVVLAFTLLALEFLVPGFYSYLFAESYSFKNISTMLFFLTCTCLFYFAIPILLSKYLYKEALTELGLCLPKNKWLAVFFMVVGIAVLIPVMLWLGKQPQFQLYYNFHQVSLGKILLLQLIICPIHYLFEEFFFRGFILITLWKKIGWHSYWISDLLFTLIHLTKPNLEILLALPVGIFLAYVALKTRSIIPCIIIHYVAGVTMLVGVNYLS